MNLQKEWSKTQFLYTSLFCEENIWQLLQSISTANTISGVKIASNQMWALIITNPAQKIALFNQQAVPTGQPIIWDYHVVMLAKIKQQFFIFDFDTRLPFVTPLHEYLQNTFIFPDRLPEKFIPYIRKIPAQSYLDRFYSDRTHMQNQIKQSEFPPWPIINAGKKHCLTLTNYLNIEQPLNDNSQVLKISSITTLNQCLVTSC